MQVEISKTFKLPILIRTSKIVKSRLAAKPTLNLMCKMNVAKLRNRKQA